MNIWNGVFDVGRRFWTLRLGLHGLHEPRLCLLFPAPRPRALLPRPVPRADRAYCDVKLRVLRLGQPDLGGHHVLWIERRLRLRNRPFAAVAPPRRAERPSTRDRARGRANACDEDAAGRFNRYEPRLA